MKLEPGGGGGGPGVYEDPNKMASMGRGNLEGFRLGPNMLMVSL